MVAAPFVRSPAPKLLRLVGLELLEALARHAEALCGVPFVISDAAGRPITSLPPGTPICPIYAGNRADLAPECRACPRSRHPLAELARAGRAGGMGGPQPLRCSVGFTHCAAPIKLKGELVGFVASGLVRDEGQPWPELGRSFLRRAAALEGTDPARTAERLEGRRTGAMTLPRERIDEAVRHVHQVVSRVLELAGERADLEARLAKADRDMLELARLANLGELVAGVLHDVRNAIHVLDLGAELLIRKLARAGDSGRPGIAEAERMRAGVSFAQSTVASVLGYLGRADTQLARFPIRRPIELALGLARLVAGRKGVAIQLGEPGGDGGWIEGRENEVAQLFLNLVLNAIEATPEGGAVAVSVAIPPGEPRRVVAEVADSGPGIDPAILPHLFEAFASTKPSPSAHGLGLTIVRRIADRHGATMDVDPGGGGRGARVGISFPAAPAGD